MNTVPGLSGGASGGSLLSGLQSNGIGAAQAGTSFLSGLASMGADQSRAASDRIQAGEWGTQAGDEGVMAQSQITGLKGQYLSSISAGSSRMAAGGLDVGQGVGQAQRTVVAQNAANTAQVDTLASDIRARRDNINQIQANEAAQQAQEAGGMALMGGILGGGLKLLTAGIL